MKFSERLDYALKRKGLKQIDLASKTGLAPGTISNYYQGKYKAKGENLRKLADALDVTEAWLAGYDAPMAKTKNDRLMLGGDLEPWELDYYSQDHPVADIAEDVTRGELDLLTAYRDADPAIQAAVRKLLDVEANK